jgi:hypothetical protein
MNCLKNATLLLILVLLGPLVRAQDIPPPVLQFPDKGDTLKLLYPAFAWSPGMPNDPAQPARHQIRLVEVLGEQTPEAAIMANPDFFAASNLYTSTFIYPFAAPLLRKYKHYAWQVTSEFEYTLSSGETNARRQAVVKSEVFDFWINDDMSDAECVPTLYTVLDDRFYVVGDKLQFQLPASVADQAGQFTYSIQDLRKNVLVRDFKPVKEPKQDQYSFDLSSAEAFRKEKSASGKFYLLEARHASGAVYWLRFTRR